MCGIFGIIRNNEIVSENELKNFTRTMAHRGPDGEGYFIDDNKGLGHRRLSIIDLSLGAQPMKDASKKYIISFNGEIYNYKELQNELIKKGYRFTTNSDTEVVINAYIEWGINSLNKLRGMFAFGIFDYSKSKLFLARDKSGIKPLVYRQEKNYFSFASEIKALDKINSQAQGEPNALSDFMQYGFIPAPLTIYKNIFKLKAGHYKEIDFNGKVHIEKPYWEPSFLNTNTKVDESIYLNELKNAVTDSVKAHLVSDLPVGVFLSGGIDSTIVASEIKKLSPNVEAFTIGFEEEAYNELEFAKIAAKRIGIKLNYKILTKDIYKDLPHILSLYDEPFGDDSSVPTWHVSKFAREKYSVVLSGDGADELFAGYSRYMEVLKKKKANLQEIRKNLKSGHLKKSVKKLLKLLSQGDNREELINFNTRLSFQERKNILKTKASKHKKGFEKLLMKVKKYTLLDKLQFIDFTNYLPYNINVKVDIASMNNSLEVRPVFLDTKIFDLAFSTNIEHKVDIENGYIGKVGLKKILTPLFTNDFIYRKKQGFSSPIKELFLKDNLYNNLLLENLKTPIVKSIINTEEVLKMLTEHHLNKNKAYNLFTILSFTIWQNNNPNVRFETH